MGIEGPAQAQFEPDPFFDPPAPKAGYAKYDAPGPGGEGGEVPQDPANGDGTVEIPPQPSPAGGNGGSSPAIGQSTSKIACHTFVYVSWKCPTGTAPSAPGSYAVMCDGKGPPNSGSPPTAGPGPGGSGSVYTGPNGANKMPECTEPWPSGTSNAPQNGPVQPPATPAPSGGGEGGGTGGGGSGPGGSGGGGGEGGSGSGAGTGGSGPGGSRGGSGGIGTFFGGGGGGGGEKEGPDIMDYPKNTSDGNTQFSIEMSDGQGATISLKPGEFVRIIQNKDGTVSVGKVSTTGGKSKFTEVQRIQPNKLLRSAILEDDPIFQGLKANAKILAGQIDYLDSQGKVLTGMVDMLAATISKISEVPDPLTGRIEKENFYPTPPLKGGVTQDEQSPLKGQVAEEPEAPRNDPRPQQKPKPKKGKSESGPSEPDPGKPGGGGGGGGNATQVVIVQDDCSQSFVKIT